MTRVRIESPGGLLPPGGSPRAPIRVWARSLDTETVRQLERIAAQPYVLGHVAAMADAHVSEGVAVGTVFVTERTVVPRALGGDLGCGMSAVRLGARAAALDRTALEDIVARLGRAIPAGAATHRGRGVGVPDALLETPLSTSALEHTRAALAARHLATLGGGNHFVELDRDPEGYVWLLVHSGSRGLGAAIAAHHARAAQGAGPAQALAGLDTETEAGAAYVADVTWALAFARANRQALVARARDVVMEAIGTDCTADEALDVHHNFVARERWLDREVWVHRKGAVAAPAGARALIPGSMGSASYVVVGRGNPLAYGSSSHGAGRVMSRRDARLAIRERAHAAAMRDVIVPRGLGASLVEESPLAYRDIGDVLDDQIDLVTRELRLEPLAVLKG